MRSMRLFWVISLFGLLILACRNAPAASEPGATPVSPSSLLFMRDNEQGGQDVWIAQGDGDGERLLVAGVQDGWIGNAYLTPDESRVAFVLYAQSSSYFYASDVQGQESKMLVSGDEVYYLPSKSGNHFLVQSFEGNNQTVRLITSDGQESKIVYEDTNEYWHYFDLPEDMGASFAYSHNPDYVDGKGSSLKVLQLETGEETEIASAYETLIFPAYQTDGENLRYFLLIPEESNGVYHTTWQLYNTNLSGSQQGLISEGVLSGNFWNIRWAHDGSSALLLTNAGYDEGYYLYKIAADGAVTTLVSRKDHIFIERYAPTEHDGYWAYQTWDSEADEYTLHLAREGEDPRSVITNYRIGFSGISRDGLRVSYVTQKEAGGNVTVYIASLDDLRVIEGGRGEDSAGSMFTSDGEYLLMAEWHSTGSLNLKSANADGSQPNQILGELSNLYGSFSPDEERLVFGGKLVNDNEGDDRWGQYLYHFASGEQLELTSAAPYPVSYDFSPDGRYIFYDVYSASQTPSPRTVYRAQVDGSQAVALISNAYSPAWASNQPTGIWTAEGTISSPGGLFGGLGGP